MRDIFAEHTQKLKVGIAKKSTDADCMTRFSKKVRHVCDGGYLASDVNS